mmetsp:Transcript_38665/g.72528  ORF Transcript_38665/g.72528 Transcript_38665/m.72528 type:complete len:208 (-) Transcript_38665:325-948(-)
MPSHCRNALVQWCTACRLCVLQHVFESIHLFIHGAPQGINVAVVFPCFQVLPVASSCSIAWVQQEELARGLILEIQVCLVNRHSLDLLPARARPSIYFSLPRLQLRNVQAVWLFSGPRVVQNEDAYAHLSVLLLHHFRHSRRQTKILQLFYSFPDVSLLFVVHQLQSSKMSSNISNDGLGHSDRSLVLLGFDGGPIADIGSVYRVSS